MKRMAIAASMLAVAALGSCGSKDDDQAATGVPLARKLANGDIHLMVEGGACLSLSEVEVDERPNEVVVHAFVVDTNGGDACTMQIVPWLTPLDLDEPLGERRLVDGSTGKDIQVVDCAKNGRYPMCKAPLS